MPEHCPRIRYGAGSSILRQAQDRQAQGERSSPIERPLIDRPSPGKGYLALLCGLILSTVAMFVVIGLLLRGEGTVGQIIAVAIFYVPMTALTLAPLHAALRTVYELSDRTLRLRSGFIIRAELDCADISEVERVSHITRVLGWGGGRGLANRLTDGLQITLHSGDVYFISPTDPAAFGDRILAVRAKRSPG